MMINAIFVNRDRNINAKIAESISINNSYKLLATIYSGLSLQTYYIVRAHRSHRWGRWFESNCHHHLEALVDQGLPLFLPFGIAAEGFTFFKVHLGEVNSSGHHSVHTVVWLSCRKIGVALLVESGKKASPKRCSGDALNLKLPGYRFIICSAN